MREIEFGGERLKIAATPLTPYLYRREFDADMIAAIAAFSDALGSDGEVVASKLPLFDLVQMIWAMAKTVNPTVPAFSAWLASLPDDALDFAGGIDLSEVISELTEGYFHGGQQAEAEEL